eukprot:g16521.t1
MVNWSLETVFGLRRRRQYRRRARRARFGAPPLLRRWRTRRGDPRPRGERSRAKRKGHVWSPMTDAFEAARKADEAARAKADVPKEAKDRLTS